jgi:hypothetical protein
MYSVIAVLTRPGGIAKTETPRGAVSAASLMVEWTSAAFVEP